MSDPLRALITKAYPYAKITATTARANDIYGREPGQSLIIDLRDGSGAWEDKNTGDKGRDVRALFAARGETDKYRAEIELAMASMVASGAPARVVPIRKGGDVIVGDTRPPSRVKHPKYGVARPEDVHWYRSVTGVYLGCSARFDLPDGGKVVPCYVAVLRPGSPATWHWRGFGNASPLYNAMALLNPDNSAQQVIVFEGEKTAQACVGATSAVATTWSGGGNAARNASWFELRGRDVILCPDYDDAGIAAMEVIGNILRGYQCRVRIVPGEAVASALGVRSPAKGWDVGDVDAEPEVIARAIIDEADKSPELPDAPSFFQTEKGDIKPSAANALLAIEGATDLEIVFNDDVKVVGYRTPPPWRVVGDGFDAMRDEDVIRLTYYLKHKHGVDFPRMGVLEGLLAVAANNTFSPWRDYLDGLTWDGVPRIDNLLVNLGCRELPVGPERELMAFSCAYIFCGVVARLYQPGIQMDMMPVLEGRQNIGKSKFIKVLAGRLTPGFDARSYVSLDLSALAGKAFNQKDAQIAVSGSIFVEIEELAQIEATDVNVLKRFISLQTDDFRPPYGATQKTYKRQCILIGTTNRQDYLRDDTGNRRFIPMNLECGPSGLDIDWLLQNRDQLFAEAVVRFREHEAAGTLQSILDLPPGLRDYHSQVTNDRFIEEPWADVLRDYFVSTDVKLDDHGRIAASTILEAVFDIKPAQQTTRVFKQLTTAMRHINAKHERVRLTGGQRRSMYKIPPKSELGESPVDTAARAHAEREDFSPFAPDKDGSISELLGDDTAI